MPEIHNTTIKIKHIFLVITSFAIFSWISVVYPELTFSSDIEEHLNGKLHEAIDPNDDIDIIAQKKIDHKRIILFTSHDTGRPGIAVYNGIFIKNMYQIQTIKMAENALSTMILETSTGNCFFVYGTNSAINADNYVVIHNRTRIEKQIMSDTSYTFDLLELKDLKMYDAPILFLHRDNHIVQNNAYIDW